MTFLKRLFFVISLYPMQIDKSNVTLKNIWTWYSGGPKPSLETLGKRRKDGSLQNHAGQFKVNSSRESRKPIEDIENHERRLQIAKRYETKLERDKPIEILAMSTMALAISRRPSSIMSAIWTLQNKWEAKPKREGPIAILEMPMIAWAILRGPSCAISVI